MSYLAILGRQPELSLAELIAVAAGGAKRLSPTAAVVEEQLRIGQLGGTLKLARQIGELSRAKPADIVAFLASRLPDEIKGSSKTSIGLSHYDTTQSAGRVFALGLELKRALKQQGLAVRIVPATGLALSTAQVIHNKLASDGIEVVLAETGTTTHVGITEQVQDIDSYAQRDHGRPARSAKVGMLPPKLAQIMINLAHSPAGATILDPFCGTGVVLQEAALLGYQTYGSDIDDELVEMSKTNLDWLSRMTSQTISSHLEVGDATTHKWTASVDAVVTEGYLGPPQSSPPSAPELADLKHEASELTLRFLSNLRPQLKAGSPVVMTLPAWRHGAKFERLGILDQIEALGYTLEQFLPVTQSDLLYFRPDQVVARELVALRSK